MRLLEITNACTFRTQGMEKEWVDIFHSVGIDATSISSRDIMTSWQALTCH